MTPIGKNYRRPWNVPIGVSESKDLIEKCGGPSPRKGEKPIALRERINMMSDQSHGTRADSIPQEAIRLSTSIDLRRAIDGARLKDWKPS